MKFEDIRKIWHEKDQSHIYVVHRDTLHHEVIEKSQKIDRAINVFDWTMFIILLAMALIMIIEGVVDQEYYQLPEGVILLVAAGYLYWDRNKRKELEKPSGGSVYQQIESTIVRLERHTTKQRNFVYWFVLPLILSVIIHFIFTYDGKPWWLWPLTVASLVFANWKMRKEAREKWQPQRRELESLRRLLGE